MAPVPHDVRIFTTPDEFRSWLDTNHDVAGELWVGYYKKGAGKTSMTYQESVDEALSFGWIDGITRRIDDEVYATRFTPRQKRSTWSLANVSRVAELTAAGRMHAAGTRAFEARTADRTGIYSYENRPADLPDEYLARLQASSEAFSWWQAQTPSYHRAATWWVVSAKQEATRQRRLTMLIEDAAAGRTVKPLRPPGTL
jgi:uncharacterized protein YdeI (YjbR/CyaY-like superfamily)